MTYDQSASAHHASIIVEHQRCLHVVGESRSLLVAKEVLKEREDALALFSPRMPKMKKLSAKNTWQVPL